MTFSGDIRKELAERHRRHAADAAWAMPGFATFVAMRGTVQERIGGWTVSLSVSGAPASRMIETTAAALGLTARAVERGKRDTVWVYDVPRELRMGLFFDFDGWAKQVEAVGMTPFFASMFLACGAMSDPSSGRYRIAFSPISDAAVSLIERLMGAEGFAVRTTEHQGKRHAFISNGEDIARFLLLSGAHNALLSFEATRARRELVGRVNRQVNFDDANASRRAESIARQLNAIDVIRRTRGLDALSPSLAEAARARLEHRGASLEELGERMDPPVSKSGMSHRFHKIRAIARTLEQEDGSTS
ncbi:MAG: DNA-binding protein WhiA [Saccharofermentanales bacterium]|jgi:DNA-binding transcriptional regulator WhiA